jgi:hypothetical protein
VRDRSAPAPARSSTSQVSSTGAGPLRELARHPRVITADWGDCEDLVFWRVAALRRREEIRRRRSRSGSVNGVYKYRAPPPVRAGRDRSGAP